MVKFRPDRDDELLVLVACLFLICFRKILDVVYQLSHLLHLTLFPDDMEALAALQNCINKNVRKSSDTNRQCIRFCLMLLYGIRWGGSSGRAWFFFVRVGVYMAGGKAIFILFRV